MVGSEGSTEEGQGVSPLVKHSAELDSRGIAVNDKLLLEVRHLQHRSQREGTLECHECLDSLWRPGECLLVQEVGQWRGNGAKILDEFPIVAGQP